MLTPTARQARWQDMELGMFFHFDIPIYAPGWDWRSWSDVPSPDVYRPDNLDTDQWLEAARAMGARYAILVAKHCSGFCQWQTDIYPYGVKQSPWRGGRGDLVADVVASCRRCGILPGLYASLSANGYLEVENPGIVNRGEGGDPAKQSEYARTCERMLEELWGRYGELFEVWFDGGVLPAKSGGPEVVPILQRHQPGALVFQGSPGMPNPIRWVGNERGVAPYPCWSTTYSTAQGDGSAREAFAGSPDGDIWAPGECDVPVRGTDWFWVAGHEDRLSSVEQLVEMYYGSVGSNCNLLLNANPGPDGLVPEADMKRYVEFGAEVRRRFERPLASASGEGRTVELELPAPCEVDHVVVMEDIRKGERVRAYDVEALAAGGEWLTVASGSCIGHKRIQRFAPVETSRLRLRVTESVADPVIRELSALHVA